jgi:hypothetical protein
MVSLDALAERFREFAGVSTATRAPLYSQLSAAVADDEDLLALLQIAPEMQQMPVLLFAAVHHLLLRDVEHGEVIPLAAHYRNLSPATTGDASATNAVALFRSYALANTERLKPLLATRNTQTNEIGRCAQFVPLLGLVADECGSLSHVDVGASAGLNLLLPRYRYDYDDGSAVTTVQGDTAPPTVTLRCGIRGRVPIPPSMPPIVRSLGLDRAPIDVLDDEEVRWLEACVWPDQADRFARLVDAIAIARTSPPVVRAGDAVADITALVDEAATSGHPVITTSWVLSYLTTDEQRAFVATLDAIGRRLDLSWVIAESPQQTAGLPVPTTDPAEAVTVLSLVRWRDGLRDVQRLATAHPHGYWVHWE